MNFLDQYNRGKEKKNIGLPTGHKSIDKAIYGVHKKKMYGIAAAPKVGKSTFANFAFVINPILYCIENDIPLNIIYFSFEVDRISFEFDLASFFFYHDYGIYQIEINSKWWNIDSSLLQGRKLDENDNVVILPQEYEDILLEIYEKRIIPFMGKYDENGQKIEEGYIQFYEKATNPTGLRNICRDYAKKHGKFLKTAYKDSDGSTKYYESGYKENDPSLYTIIITDHLRKLKMERGYTKKQNTDKWIEYSVELRNMCQFTFVHIIHLNRNLANIDRLRYLGDKIFPNGDDIKDTGNLSEEVNYLFTMMNPGDEKYGLKSHFGVKLKGLPNYRSIHLVEARDTECPQHFRTNMYGNIKTFTPEVLQFKTNEE